MLIPPLDPGEVARGNPHFAGVPLREVARDVDSESGVRELDPWAADRGYVAVRFYWDTARFYSDRAHCPRAVYGFHKPTSQWHLWEN